MITLPRILNLDLGVARPRNTPTAMAQRGGRREEGAERRGHTLVPSCVQRGRAAHPRCSTRVVFGRSARLPPTREKSQTRPKALARAAVRPSQGARRRSRAMPSLTPTRSCTLVAASRNKASGTLRRDSTRKHRGDVGTESGGNCSQQRTVARFPIGRRSIDAAACLLAIWDCRQRPAKRAVGLGASHSPVRNTRRQRFRVRAIEYVSEPKARPPSRQSSVLLCQLLSSHVRCRRRRIATVQGRRMHKAVLPQLAQHREFRVTPLDGERWRRS